MQRDFTQIIASVPVMFGYVPQDALVVGAMSTVERFTLLDGGLADEEIADHIKDWIEDPDELVVLIAVGDKARELLDLGFRATDNTLFMACAVTSFKPGSRWREFTSETEGEVSDYRTLEGAARRVFDGWPIFPDWNAVLGVYEARRPGPASARHVRGGAAKARMAQTVLCGEPFDVAVARRIFIDDTRSQDALALADKNPQAAYTAFTRCVQTLGGGARYRALFAAGYAALRCGRPELAIAALETMEIEGCPDDERADLASVLRRALDTAPNEADELWETSRADFVMPSRVTTAWLAENVAYLGRADVVALLEGLRSRGWSQRRIEEAVSPLLGELAP